MEEQIKQWIDEFVSIHNESLNQIPCPYAKNALIKYIETDSIAQSLADTKNNWTDDIEVVCLYTATENYTPWMLTKLVEIFNMEAMHKDLVALEDHPLNEEIINGAKMNFGLCSLVLVQRLSKLNNASNILKEKGYYKNWSKENLADVVNWRFDELFVRKD